MAHSATITGRSKPKKESEKVTEQYINLIFKRAGGRTIKIKADGVDSYPDRLLCLGDAFAFAEIKSEGVKPTPKQKAMHRIMREEGLKVYVVDTKAGADAVLRDLQEKAARIGSILSER